jgi:hypothetical protein
VTWHCPFTQPSPLPQTVEQLPQCCASLCRLTQVPPQSLSPLGQTHWPATHCFPPLHAFAQAPQCAASPCRSVQLPLQQLLPPEQSPLLPQVQALLTQLSPGAQAWPQAPQLAASLAVFTSQPVFGFLSQSAKPVRQAKPQAPPAQTAVACAGVGQARSQLPQWLASVSVFTQEPPQRVWPVPQPPP